MAVYKVIQDIEAEDKIIGPLTLKGFIYAATAGLLIFIDIRLWIGGFSTIVKTICTLIFLPPTVLFATLASPLGREQPTEVWLFSRISFLFKPHTRRWNQAGIKELVKVTAPKKIERILTKNISQTEVKSRLQSLANTLDSRGWVVKNANINLTDSADVGALEADDDRLVGAATFEQAEPVLEIHAADDILDEQNNPTAQNVNNLMAEAEVTRRELTKLHMDDVRQAADDAAPDEKALLDKIHAQDAALKNHPPIIRGGATPVTGAVQTAKLELAKAGNALSVASIAKLANRASQNQEVDIELH